MFRSQDVFLLPGPLQPSIFLCMTSFQSLYFWPRMRNPNYPILCFFIVSNNLLSELANCSTSRLLTYLVHEIRKHSSMKPHLLCFQIINWFYRVTYVVVSVPLSWIDYICIQYNNNMLTFYVYFKTGESIQEDGMLYTSVNELLHLK